MKKPSENSIGRDVLAQASAGDVDSFRLLYIRYGPNIYRYAMLQTGSHEAAEDVLQETMIGVWRGRKKLSEIGSISAWIMAIARNKTFDYIRSKAPTVSIGTFEGVMGADDSDATVGVHMIDTPTWNRTGSEAHSPVSDRVDLTTALLQLDMEKRELLFLVFYLDMSYTEIADLLEIPVGTVKSRVYHARRKLREVFDRGLESC